MFDHARPLRSQLAYRTKHIRITFRPRLFDEDAQCEKKRAADASGAAVDAHRALLQLRRRSGRIAERTSRQRVYGQSDERRDLLRCGTIIRRIAIGWHWTPSEELDVRRVHLLAGFRAPHDKAPLDVRRKRDSFRKLQSKYTINLKKKHNRQIIAIFSPVRKRTLP